MHTTVTIVNIPVAQILRLASFRTLYTVARYNTVDVYKRASKAHIADILADALTAESPEAHATRLLNQSDIDSLSTLCQHIARQQEAGQTIIDLPPTIAITSQTHFPRTLYRQRSQLPLDQLEPIERLMVFGFIIPIVSPPPKTARLLIHSSTAQALLQLHSIMPPPPPTANKPPTLPLAHIAGEAVTILAVLSTQPTHHAPKDPIPGHIMRHLQARSPFATLIVDRNLRPRAIADALDIIHTLLHQQGYLSLINGRCLPTSLTPTLLALTAEQMAQCLLRQPDPKPITASTASATLQAPTINRHTIIFPAQSPGSLRYQLEAWTNPDASHTSTSVDTGSLAYSCTFTHSSVRQGILLYGSPRPLLTILRRNFPVIPPSLLDLINSASQLGQVRLASRTLLQANDPHTIDRLRAYSSIRRSLGPRIGPHTIEVRHEAPIRCALHRLGLLDLEQPAHKTPRPAPDLIPAIPGNEPDHEDLFHIVLALRLAQETASASMSAYAPAFARLANRLAQNLGVNHRLTLDEVNVPTDLDASDGGETPIDPDVPPISALDPTALHRTLRIAMENGLNVRMRYYTEGRAVTGWRTVQPAHITYQHMAAFCIRSQKERLFRLDRILEIEPLGDYSAQVAAEFGKRSIRRLRLGQAVMPNRAVKKQYNFAPTAEESEPTVFLEEDYYDLITQ